MQSFVLMGLESAGKSTLFNILTESAASDERNFSGSTVVCREGFIKQAGICMVDIPASGNAGMDLHGLPGASVA